MPVDAKSAAVRFDGLWFAGLLSNKQRKDATHHLRRMVHGLGRSIIDLERRARESARRAGKTFCQTPTARLHGARYPGPLFHSRCG
ncbi:hypothetical protein [Halochromatium salexigens]|uniref:hypothetical protein n=1 Tax=Halochromatium salexigens TaxID=49447 RepID=UPI0019112B2E|nr:hypothetical protein [Halochromatium salexigens]